MILKKLYTKCGVHSSPLSLFTKFGVFRTFSVIFMLSKNVWKNSGFLKRNKGLPCTPGLVSSFLSSFGHIFQRVSDKYFQVEKIK